jgi:L-cysteine desulfidase
MRRTILTAALALGAASISAPAAAQQSGLVNVNVSNIRVMLDEVISKNNLNVQVPVDAIVQIPIGLAANVCGTTVAVLGAAGTDAAPCNATTENTNQGEAQAIARALQRQ